MIEGEAVKENFNPYLKEFKAVKHSIEDYKVRDVLVKKYAWAIPDNAAIEAIKSLGKAILEIGAGSGYWARVLSEAGISVTCFDALTGQYSFTENWFEVNKGSIEQIKGNSDKALMLCWPNYDEPFAYDAAIEYMEQGGNTLIYIGESQGGCTADDKFFELMRKEWVVKQEVMIPNWFGIHDSLVIYTRK